MAGSTNFPTSLDSFGDVTDNVDDVEADHVNDQRRSVEALEAKVGIDSSGVDTSLDYKINNFFVENTRVVYFYENSPPTGWSTSGLPTDRVIAVKGSGAGSQYTATGGSTDGDWANSTGITVSSHTHPLAAAVMSVTVGAWPDADCADDDASSSGATAGTSDTASWRPNAAVGILAKYVGA